MIIDELEKIVKQNIKLIMPFVKNKQLTLMDKNNVIYPYGVSSCDQGGFRGKKDEFFFPTWISYDSVTGEIKPPVYDDRNTSIVRVDCYNDFIDYQASEAGIELTRALEQGRIKQDPATGALIVTGQNLERDLGLDIVRAECARSEVESSKKMWGHMALNYLPIKEYDGVMNGDRVILWTLEECNKQLKPAYNA